jgi:hypothetical protein
MGFPMELIKNTWVTESSYWMLPESPGDDVQVWDCLGCGNQQWRKTAQWDETYRLSAVNSDPAPFEIVMNHEMLLSSC